MFSFVSFQEWWGLCLYIFLYIYVYESFAVELIAYCVLSGLNEPETKRDIRYFRGGKRTQN